MTIATSHDFHVEHRRLACGIELAVLRLPGRPVTALEIRMFAGYAFEDARYLGVTHLVEETIGKGTARRDGRAFHDAFDEIGATHAAFTGRETIGFSSLCLPEYLSQAIDLHAEAITVPSFPQDACKVAVELAEQSLDALQDDPGELAKKLLYAQAYGQPLGRHPLGEPETLGRIGREQIEQHWRKFFAPGRMLAVVAGDIEFAVVADRLEAAFAAHVKATPAEGCDANTARFAINFEPKYRHYEKDTEQEQIAVCFPGAAKTDEDYAVEKVVIGILAGGMSGRLFTEVREKQGLVYWVGAWTDHPRAGGMVHLGASTTPQNLDRTYSTLLREMDRLGEDVTTAELDRAIAGLVTRARTRGDVTRARAAEAVDDLFFYGRVIPVEQKLAKIAAVTLQDVREYLNSHPRDRLSAVTVGQKGLNA